MAWEWPQKMSQIKVCARFYCYYSPSRNNECCQICHHHNNARKKQTPFMTQWGGKIVYRPSKFGAITFALFESVICCRKRVGSKEKAVMLFHFSHTFLFFLIQITRYYWGEPWLAFLYTRRQHKTATLFSNTKGVKNVVYRSFVHAPFLCVCVYVALWGVCMRVCVLCTVF